jgi:hypothetical protein
MKIYQFGSCYSPSESCTRGSGLSDYKSNSTFSGQWISRLRKYKTSLSLLTQDDLFQTKIASKPALAAVFLFDIFTLVIWSTSSLRI